MGVTAMKEIFEEVIADHEEIQKQREGELQYECGILTCGH